MLKNGIYNLIGSIFRLATGAILTPVLIRLLGLEDYGLWILVSSTLVLVTLAEGGLAASTTFFISRELSSERKSSLLEIIGITSLAMLLLASLMCLLMFCLAPVLSGIFPHITDIQRNLLVPTLRWGVLQYGSVCYRELQLE